jgi:hypothetical protein
MARPPFLQNIVGVALLMVCFCPPTPYTPPFPQEHAITSDEALSLQELPPGPIVVLGAGYVLVWGAIVTLLPPCTQTCCLPSHLSVVLECAVISMLVWAACLPDV